MKNKDQMGMDDNFIDQQIAEAYGYGDQQLADLLDQVTEEAKSQDQETRLRAPEGQWEKIMNRLEHQEKASGQKRKAIRMRKMIKTLVAAAVLGTMVIGGSMWVGAKRYYPYAVRERADMQNVVVFNNSGENLIGDSGVIEAYEEIRDKLNIRVFELSYLPDGMEFYKVEIEKRTGIIGFKKEDKDILLRQGVSDKPSSLSYASDMEKDRTVYNSFLDKEITIYRQKVEGEEFEFSIQIIDGNQFCFLQGIIDEDEFSRIVQGIKRYED